MMSFTVPLMPLLGAKKHLVDLLDTRSSRPIRAMAALLQGYADSLPVLERALLVKAFRGELVAQEPRG